MKFARGFKTHCERAVTALRAELEVDDEAPIDMHSLATHLYIPVHSLATLLITSGQSRSHPKVDEIYCKVSALTVFDGTFRTIIYNDEHPLTRHRSNMAHELAHALLQHPPSNSGLAAHQEEMHEAEAGWMGGVLMLTAGQARRIAGSRMNRTTAETQYQLSPEMLRFRLNVTGAARLAFM